MLKSRKEKLEEMYNVAEKVVRRMYPDGKINTDELTALSVAHFSNYLPEVIPEIRPFLARIVSAILDLEILSEGKVIAHIEPKDAESSKQSESSVSRNGNNSNPESNEGNNKPNV